MLFASPYVGCWEGSGREACVCLTFVCVNTSGIGTNEVKMQKNLVKIYLCLIFWEAYFCSFSTLAFF